MTSAKLEHHIERKVFYHHTDAGGVVYYATYLHFLEEGRFEFLLSRGIDTSALAKQGIVFPVVHLSVDYKAPARYGDTIKIYSRVEKIGNSSVHFHQEIKREDVLLVKAATVWACVGRDFQARALPEEMTKLSSG